MCGEHARPAVSMPKPKRQRTGSLVADFEPNLQDIIDDDQQGRVDSEPHPAPWKHLNIATYGIGLLRFEKSQYLLVAAANASSDNARLSQALDSALCEARGSPIFDIEEFLAFHREEIEEASDGLAPRLRNAFNNYRKLVKPRILFKDETDAELQLLALVAEKVGETKEPIVGYDALLTRNTCTECLCLHEDANITTIVGRDNTIKALDDNKVLKDAIVEYFPEQGPAFLDNLAHVNTDTISFVTATTAGLARLGGGCLVL